VCLQILKLRKITALLVELATFTLLSTIPMSSGMKPCLVDET